MTRTLVPRSSVFALIFYIFHITPTQQLDIDNCVSDVGLESGSLPDTALSASSSYDPLNVGPQHARLGQDTAGGAWCPQHPVGPEPESHQEWIGVNMSYPHVISSVLTQGRYAQGQGQEYTMAYRIMYWRQGMQRFKEYRDSMGRNILLGNSDTFNVATNTLNPPVIASAIRILPYSNHSRTVCLRVGLIGCPFEESLLSYNVPQGMVRGATLELLDITYDGLEDPISGFLTGGLGQLVDGKYGTENYRAVGENGIVRGYEWVGWKNKSMGPLQMDFTFLNIRKFDQVIIHINNHYTKDIQIFSRAKIYFSNEEGKYGDDRAVDYLYMPDRMVEDARNVSINLHGEHGKYVMIQLFFADKWMLISEVTFVSRKYEEEKPNAINDKFDSVGKDKMDQTHDNDEVTPGQVTSTETASTVQYSAVQTEAPHQNYGSSHAGLIIGILLTIISLLIGAIIYVVYQARLRSDKNTPTHQHLSSHSACITDKIQKKLAASLDFEDFTSTYRAKMKVYGQVSALDDESNVYTASTTTRQYSRSSQNIGSYGHRMLSDEVSDDYAEPHHVVPRTSQEQIYQSVNHLPPVISHSSLSSPSSLDVSQSRHLYSSSVGALGAGPYQQPTYQKIRKTRKHRSSSQNIYQSVNNCHSMSNVDSFSNIPTSGKIELNVVRKSQLKIVERLGSGRFGEAHLCYFIGNKSSALVVVKSLDTSCSFEKRREFQEEAKILSMVLDHNIAPVLGVNLDDDPWYIVREFSEQGDLTQFLQNHVAESSASKLSDIPTLSYGALMYMATQIASGMKCLESCNFAHKDLATRNCQVYSDYHVKISDIGSVRTMYTSDYYHQLPIRWMSWEAVIRGAYGTKSDVWSFGVTMWEILTFAREQPYEQLSDKEVVENLNEMVTNESLSDLLHQPYNCPRDVYELMLECWSKHTEDRPDFQEISLFLMRKNLGFDPNDE